jgi:elongation factor P
MSSPNDIKKGTVIHYEGNLWVVTGFQRVSPGKGSSFVRTRMKNIQTGKVIETNFKSSETLEFEDVNYLKMQYLFNDGNMFTFMNNQTYEQIEIQKDSIEESIPYLKDGLEVTVTMHGDNALTIELPKKIEYVIASAPPAVKGDTASGNVTKEAVMDNGLKVQVPIFINEGEKILVNTDTGSYSERVNS